MDGDIASHMVEGIDKFLLRKTDESVERRAERWKRDFTSRANYEKSIDPYRERLAHLLGVRDPRVTFHAPELVATTLQPALVGRGAGYEVFAVRWPAIGDVHGEGLLLVPKGKKLADIIAIPDANQTPEQIVGLQPGVPAEWQYARRLAESGCRVIVPTLINRTVEARNGRAKLTGREFLHRSAFELGRTLIGYEVQKVLAAVDWFVKDAGSEKPRIGVIGYGEGGMLALYAAALDKRIGCACVSGYFDDRRNNWRAPLDRNVFGLLEEFGDAELAAMIVPRFTIVEPAPGPEVKLEGQGGAPSDLRSPDPKAVSNELSRGGKMVKSIADAPSPYFSYTMDRIPERFACDVAMGELILGILEPPHEKIGDPPPGADQPRREVITPSGPPPENLRKSFDPKLRQARLIHEIDRHNQQLLTECAKVRQNFMKKLDTSSIEKVEKSAEWYRDYFRDEVIGHFDDKPMAFNARSRRIYDKPSWAGYEVVLDVFPDVIAYGILLLPKDMKDGEKRPVVVCQHGLEGRPKESIEGDHPAYHDFAAKLADRGFIVFAPQNPYIFGDRFRTLQRKANPLKKTLFSIIVPQHQQIVNWLKTLPHVDPSRIGFYGLSYGGKTAMRVVPLVPDYCLAICSADFGEWVWKNASTTSPFSYVWSGEYEIFEFDLGNTFNYAEMAALIAPRPFMVERGQFDGVQPDETVAYEFAKVRHLYQAKLGIGERCRIEWFVGPHTINGKGTFGFLHEHLKWPKR